MGTFEIKTLGEYHDLYVQCDTSLLADLFENIRNMCLNAYGLDPTHFLSPAGLAWQACLKETKVELESLTDIDMLLMVEKELEAEFAKQYIGMLKQIKSLLKIIIKIMNHHIQNIQMLTICMDGQCLKNYQ